MRDIWNPWHGCRKYSTGCERCYMYALDAMRGVTTPSSEVRRTKSFRYPLTKARDGSYKLRPGERLRVNMTSDTFIEEAEGWLPEFWDIIRQRPDLRFWILTKRAHRIERSLPPDWGNGYPNVSLNITTENQAAFDERWPIFRDIPAAEKGICCAPLLSDIDLTPALTSGQIAEISAGGENYENPRPCDYAWAESLSRQCRAYGIPFCFYETGTRLIKNGKIYEIPYKKDQSKLAYLSGLSTETATKQNDTRRFNPLHCVCCANRAMCNGCDPACPRRDKSYRLVTAAEIDALDAAWKQQNNRKQGGQP